MSWREADAAIEGVHGPAHGTAEPQEPPTRFAARPLRTPGRTR
ncbi:MULTISPECIES: hypothetical protein [Nocardiopsis]|uniref:Uncharacterized protein n=1 Tax=Nocardiopsis metallicus TaxID=179819 RepID=A0A840WGG8_9ACTN|nr:MULTISPECIES: hypothetical protein [Nocardiopsis]MBB5490476.1 hypothetical protein [Nocardiopsis metallicus]